jgi:hypothetical protein
MRPAREISWEISGTSVATGIVEDVGFAGDCGWARQDSNLRPTDYESRKRAQVGSGSPEFADVARAARVCLPAEPSCLPAGLGLETWRSGSTVSGLLNRGGRRVPVETLGAGVRRANPARPGLIGPLSAALRPGGYSAGTAGGGPTGPLLSAFVRLFPGAAWSQKALPRAKYRSGSAKRRTGLEPATSSLGSLRSTN